MDEIITARLLVTHDVATNYKFRLIHLLYYLFMNYLLITCSEKSIQALRVQYDVMNRQVKLYVISSEIIY